jgi:hypothetical protein
MDKGYQPGHPYLNMEELQSLIKVIGKIVLSLLFASKTLTCLLCLHSACATAIALAHAVGEARPSGNDTNSHKVSLIVASLCAFVF